MSRVHFLGVIAACFFWGTPACPAQDKADLAAFHDYLAKHKLDAKWQGDPKRLDSEEIRKAYPGRRVYFTYAAPPVPPGANSKRLLEDYRRRVKEFEKHSLRLTVTIDDQHQVTALEKPADYNVGLMPVKTDADARVAAAAILAMASMPAQGFTRPGSMPAPLPAGQVVVAKDGGGWVCTAKVKRGFDGSVRFDARGRCTAVTKVANFIQAPPP